VALVTKVLFYFLITFLSPPIVKVSNLYTQTFSKEDSSMDLQSNSQLGSYLAGLIEGDEICCKR